MIAMLHKPLCIQLQSHFINCSQLLIGSQLLYVNQFEGLIHISKFFGISETDLLHMDLEQAHVMGEFTFDENGVLQKSPGNPRFVFSKEKDAFIPTDQLFYNNDQNQKEDIVQALREVIEMQKALIHSLNDVIDMLREQLSAYKK